MKYLEKTISDEYIIELDRADMRKVFNWAALKACINSQYGALPENTSSKIERILQNGRMFIQPDVKEWLDATVVDKNEMPLWSIRPSVSSYVNGEVSSVCLTFYRKEHAMMFKVMYG